MSPRISITVMICSLLLGLLGCGGGFQKTIASVEEMSLTLRGMRGSFVYIFRWDTKELRRCREVYRGEETVLELEAATPCNRQTMTALMNTCGVPRWDGFHGKHPKNVQDGIAFIFSATVNGEQTIRAEGSANFPKGYHEFVRTLDAMLAESETQK